MQITLAQMNPVVGDIDGNINKLKNVIDGIKPGATDLVVFPEMYLCGYPPRDLLNLPWFIDRLEESLDRIKEISFDRPDLGILFGTVRHSGKVTGKGLFNSALLIENGKLLFEQHKQLLPTYDVFDEQRYFDVSHSSQVYNYRGVKLGISICEDAWNDPDFEEKLRQVLTPDATPIYDRNPIAMLAHNNAELLINISASPYHLHKDQIRNERYAHHSRRWGVPLIFVGQVGANDDLIFDGRSMAFDKQGRIFAIAKAFEEDVITIDSAQTGSDDEYTGLPDMEALRRALVLGIQDYFRKCGFKTAIIGLSGGIDSALTTCLAVDAIGSENVRVITMPSQFSSTGSVDDSLQLARNLGIQCDIIPISDIFDQYVTSLKMPFEGLSSDVTEENIQARIRGNLLMAYANKYGGIVLATGNKSELAMGYCTLYGDMSGGLAVISDLPKMIVYELSRWYNDPNFQSSEIIPQAILDKAPSAELRSDQKDEDSLPPYPILDEILEMYLEKRLSPQQIVSSGFDSETVNQVIRTVDLNEYKRLQAAPGLRVTTKAFGTGWRMPIASKRS
ncbi:MAG: NAD+ synthase [Candidatus Hatepunaea meridiana]|nr:NAD+ synthase [Candidatus Hatepunaea meridiana]